MRILMLISALAVAVPDRPAPMAPEMPPDPKTMILGDWRDAGTPNYTLRFTPTESFFLVGGKTSEVDGLTAIYAIDWSTDPTTITFMPKQRGGKMPGLFKLEGDKLTLGLRTGGGMQPRDFKSCDLVLHYHRVKQ
jgi:uncharacterized protein (TIGR03067 family)